MWVYIFGILFEMSAMHKALLYDLAAIRRFLEKPVSTCEILEIKTFLKRWELLCSTAMMTLGVRIEEFFTHFRTTDLKADLKRSEIQKKEQIQMFPFK